MTIPEFAIDDVISSDTWFGGISSRALRDFLVTNATAPEVLVRINSPGGDATEGVSMYSALKRCGARVIVEVDGLAASAASIAAMAGDEIRVHKGALLMIHEAWSMTFGTADELRKTAGVLTKLNGEMADLYAARSGQNRAAVLNMMAEETWLTAEEAKAKGFATSVVPAKTVASPAPSARAHSTAQALLGGYKHTPSTLRPAAQANGSWKPLAELAGTPPAADTVPTFRGLTYDELQPLEKALLSRQDPALYMRMQAAPSKPKTFAQLSGPQREQLVREDYAKYARMRDAGHAGTETWTPKGWA